MKQHLVIVAHPNSQSFTQAIADAVVEASEKLEVNVVVRNLYNMNFNPVLSPEEFQASWQGIIPEEIRYEQNLIAQADLITLIYPLWWMGFPAILKGYLDRVLTHGFAYKVEPEGSVGLLSDKKLQQFINMGSDLAVYEEKGFTQSLDSCLVNGLFNFCGITNIDHQIFGRIFATTEKDRQKILADVQKKTQQNLTAL